MYQKNFIDYNLPKILDENETHYLLNLINNGDIQAKNKFINHNIKLVLRVVNNRFKYIEYDKEDLVSIGMFGLIKAVETYDKTRNFEFSTYAIKCIENEIKQFLRSLYRKSKYKFVSLDSEIFNNDEKENIKQINVLKNNTDIEKEYIDKETSEIINTIISELPVKDKKMIMMYFGFNQYVNKNYTKDEIAKELGFSRAYLYKRLEKILSRIKNRLLNENLYVSNEQKINKKVLKP